AHNVMAQTTAPAWAPGLQKIMDQPSTTPTEAATAPTPLPPVAAPQATLLPPPSPADAPEAHWKAPAVIVDLGEPPSAAPAQFRLAQAGAPTPGGAAAGAAGAPEGGPNAEERFAARVSGAGNETARATQMHNVA